MPPKGASQFFMSWATRLTFSRTSGPSMLTSSTIKTLTFCQRILAKRFFLTLRTESDAHKTQTCAKTVARLPA